MPELDIQVLGALFQSLVTMVDAEVKTFPLSERHARSHEITFGLMETVWGGMLGFPREPGRDATPTEINGLLVLDAIQRSLPRHDLPTKLRTAPPIPFVTPPELQENPSWRN